MHRYKVLGKKGEGTFSEVLRACSLDSPQREVAIKCMKRRYTSSAEINDLLEIQALKQLGAHPHIVGLQEVLFEQGRLAMVFELMDMNLYELIKDRKTHLAEQRVSRWMLQLGLALAFVHSAGLMHRDVKPENVLLSGSNLDHLKLADLGSSCRIGQRRRSSGFISISSGNPAHTEYISTRWYRSPQCLLTSGFYGPKMDIWAMGCVWTETLTLQPLFPGKDELDQINRIHQILGSPDRETLSTFRRHSHGALKDISLPTFRSDNGLKIKLSHCSDDVICIISKLLAYEETTRFSSSELILSPFWNQFKDVSIDCIPIPPPVRKSEPRAPLAMHPSVAVTDAKIKLALQKNYEEKKFDSVGGLSTDLYPTLISPKKRAPFRVNAVLAREATLLPPLVSHPYNRNP